MSYSPVPNETFDIKNDENLHVSSPKRTVGFTKLVIWSLATLSLLLAVSNVIQYNHLHLKSLNYSYSMSPCFHLSRNTDSKAVADFGPPIPKPFLWRTDYNSDNATLSDTLWQALHPAHGVIAMPKTWAVSKQLPTSMDLPSDSSKSVYILEAYHHLHCLVPTTRNSLQTSTASSLANLI